MTIRSVLFRALSHFLNLIYLRSPHSEVYWGFDYVPLASVDWLGVTNAWKVLTWLITLGCDSCSVALKPNREPRLSLASSVFSLKVHFNSKNLHQLYYFLPYFLSFGGACTGEMLPLSLDDSLFTSARSVLPRTPLKRHRNTTARLLWLCSSIVRNDIC